MCMYSYIRVCVYLPLQIYIIHMYFQASEWLRRKADKRKKNVFVATVENLAITVWNSPMHQDVVPRISALQSDKTRFEFCYIYFTELPWSLNNILSAHEQSARTWQALNKHWFLFFSIRTRPETLAGQEVLPIISMSTDSRIQNECSQLAEPMINESVWNGNSAVTG